MSPQDLIKDPRALVGLVAGVLATLFTISWWFFGHVAQAENDHVEQIELVEVVKQLAAIHVKIDTVAEAEAAQLGRLCRRGKLPPEDCPQPRVLVPTTNPN